MLATLLAVYLVALPPPEYDKPHPGMIIEYAWPNDIGRKCKDLRFVACAFPWENPCRIIIPHGTKPTSRIYRHEQGHCNGWPRDHRRGIGG